MTVVELLSEIFGQLWTKMSRSSMFWQLIAPGMKIELEGVSLLGQLHKPLSRIAFPRHSEQVFVQAFGSLMSQMVHLPR